MKGIVQALIGFIATPAIVEEGWMLARKSKTKEVRCPSRSLIAMEQEVRMS